MEELWLLGGFVLAAVIGAYAVAGSKRGRSKADPNGWTSEDAAPPTRQMRDNEGGYR